MRPSAEASAEPFPRAFFQALAALSRRRRLVRGGERTTAARGFAQYGGERRPWRPGEPLRAVDWRAAARRETGLWVRERERERGGRLVVVLDRSASMAPGGEPWRDLASRRLAFAAAALALEEGARVEVHHGGGVPLRIAGAGWSARLRALLEELSPPAGPGGALPALRPGADLVVVTDPWLPDPAWWELADLAPRHRSCRVVFLTLRREAAPPAEALELVDAETGRVLPVDLRDAHRTRRAHDAHLRFLLQRAARDRIQAAVLAADPPAGGPAALLRHAHAAGVL